MKITKFKYLAGKDQSIFPKSDLKIQSVPLSLLTHFRFYQRKQAQKIDKAFCKLFCFVFYSPIFPLEPMTAKHNPQWSSETKGGGQRPAAPGNSAAKRARVAFPDLWDQYPKKKKKDDDINACPTTVTTALPPPCLLLLVRFPCRKVVWLLAYSQIACPVSKWTRKREVLRRRNGNTV